jgi:hypothetical protein
MRKILRAFMMVLIFLLMGLTSACSNSNVTNGNDANDALAKPDQVATSVLNVTNGNNANDALAKPDEVMTAALPPEIYFACLDAQEGTTIYAKFYGKKIDESTKLGADYLFGRALDTAQEVRYKYELWKNLVPTISVLHKALQLDDWDTAEQVVPDLVYLCGIE